mmetsp:Transcript_50337/g.116196  ORF Transcript_50337/g.116196 Transcript_50337/m.116196 type:complete len:254 (-) Transcript_50337:263-1024(-)
MTTCRPRDAFAERTKHRRRVAEIIHHCRPARRLLHPKSPQLLKHPIIGRLACMQSQTPNCVCPCAIFAAHESVRARTQLLLDEGDKIALRIAQVLTHHVLGAQKANVSPRQHQSDPHQTDVCTVHVRRHVQQLLVCHLEHVPQLLRDGRVVDRVHAIAARDGRNRLRIYGVVAVGVLPMRIGHTNMCGDVGRAIEEHLRRPIGGLEQPRRPAKVLIVLVARAHLVVERVIPKEADARERHVGVGGRIVFASEA